ncbi:alpha-ketoglutarate decarboxylase [Robertkochia marina]|uniref:Alpha-ketoglutarate decarboxylase n=1 Tax=Robertkochia marina TaxID=1227945 RepID=A0A4S3M410_9FLAO|nr:alpha-ketoglutarate decarboxylase [Robertkochia marina]THD69041.1 alpha-ketoglutarate decarboxylase [Robertkochia marina]TRZ44864.1 alpha-ketoglutarate decarboxylase [Robertkochia marina]
MRIPLNFFIKPLAPLLLCLFLYLPTHAQTYSPPGSPGFGDRIRYGGSIGLGFANNFFSATLAPSAIYQVNPYFATGVGLNFSYASEKDFYKSTIIGGSLIALFTPIRELQLSAEFEELNVRRNFENSLGFTDRSYWYPALFLGAGFNSGPVTFGVRYDVLYDRDKSIYGNAWIPFVRVYF